MNKENELDFLIIWRYKVRSEYIELFELEYGNNGAWVRLFNESPDYRGSFLYKDSNLSDTYVVIDCWKDELSYLIFYKLIEDIYSKMNRRFANIYLSEEKIGNLKK